jgi:hypothetical protein
MVVALLVNLAIYAHQVQTASVRDLIALMFSDFYLTVFVI